MNDSASHARQWMAKARNDLVAGEARYDIEFSLDEQTARDAIALAAEVCTAVATAIV